MGSRKRESSKQELDYNPSKHSRHGSDHKSEKRSRRRELDERRDDRVNRSSRRRRRSYSREDRYHETEKDGEMKYERYYGGEAGQPPSVSTPGEKEKEKEKEQPPPNVITPSQKKTVDLLTSRTGGAYIPPAKLRMMQANITDKTSAAYQRIAWEALKKSIHGQINKVTTENIGIIVRELLRENIVRGRGLLCRSIIQAQAASPTFTNVYAALIAVINSKFPSIGELLLRRCVIQFRRGYKRNDKATCISAATFIAHLVNQRVAHEIIALEILTLLVETPTEDSVEVAIAFLKECGQKLGEVTSKGMRAIFEMLRNILHEGQLNKKVQYMIEVMFQVWKDGFKDHPSVVDKLDLVEEEEQFTHLITLAEATDGQDILNVYKYDGEYEVNEEKYKTLQREILGESDTGSEGEGECGSDGDSDDDADEGGSEDGSDQDGGEGKEKESIIDKTETNLVALRKTIYLTIHSSLDFEECAHKLLRMELKPGQEIEMCHMFLDCCAEQRTYEKFFGLLAQRFCQINKIYVGPFEEIFKDSYATIHRVETNKLRNVAKLFAHLLHTDAISWEVLSTVRLNEEDTTSSSRIFIKILFQELSEYMGLAKLNQRVKDPTLQSALEGLFPRDNPNNTRFAINFFTSIGLGGLTDELREHLKAQPRVTSSSNTVVPQLVEEVLTSTSSSSSASTTSESESLSSSSNDSTSSESSSEDESGKDKKKRKKKKEGRKVKRKNRNSRRDKGSKLKGKDRDRLDRDWIGKKGRGKLLSSQNRSGKGKRKEERGTKERKKARR